MKKVEILIADKNLVFGKALAKVLGGIANTNITYGDFKNLSVPEYMTKFQFDVLFYTIQFPVSENIGILKNISQLFPNLKIIALSLYEDTFLSKAALTGFVHSIIDKNEIEFTTMEAIINNCIIDKEKNIKKVLV